MLKCQILSPLNKVFCDHVKNPHELKQVSVLRGETVSFQLIFSADNRSGIKISTEKSPVTKYLLMRHVKYMGAVNSRNTQKEGDQYHQYFEGVGPGLYPDLLTDCSGDITVPTQTTQAVWCDLAIPARFAAGEYTVSFALKINDIAEGKTYEKKLSLKVQVINAVLPPQTLKHTEWFYCDCIAQAHNVKPWSDAFWKILEKYFLNFSGHGMNMVLTPVFTPPLDTAVNGERLTCQLVRVKRTKKVWSFDFRDLRKWIALAEKCGIRYFEIAHLFTQWGAAATPKVIANVDGIEKRVFGWDVPSNSPEWDKFLAAFLPALKKALLAAGVYDRCAFHASDEPVPTNMENYRRVSGLLRKHLPGIKLMDAVSHTEFFKEGLCENPVAIISALPDFMKLPIKERWTYYCCGPEFPYPNRFYYLPSAANRIVGVLFYLYEVKGFLHWGYNFWNLGLSGKYAMPGSPEGDICYPSGDGCLVYPGKEGPNGSIREEVLFHALEDMRALQLLEKLSDRKTVLALIKKAAGGTIPELNKYPLEPGFFHDLRKAVNEKIQKLSSKA